MDLNSLTMDEKKALVEELSRETGTGAGKAPVKPVKHIVCSCGFECDIDPDVLDDMELYDDLMALDNERPNVKPILVRILGEEGQKSLYESCRVEGKVRVSIVNNSLYEIFDQMKAKN